MDRTDSTQAMQSLLTYAESESDSDDEAAVQPSSESANPDQSLGENDLSTMKQQTTKVETVSETSITDPSGLQTANVNTTNDISSSESEEAKPAESASPKSASVEEPVGLLGVASATDGGSSTDPPITEKPSSAALISETTVVEEISMGGAINPAPATEDPEKVVEADENSVLTGQIDDSDEEPEETEPEEKSAAALLIQEPKAFSIDLDANSNQASPVDVLNISQKPALPRPPTATKLVSYGMEELDADDDDDDDDMAEGAAGAPEGGEQPTSSAVGEADGAQTSTSAAATAEDSEQAAAARARSALIPPPPPGHCSKRLQEKLLPFFAKRFREGVDLNHRIQNKKEFRNPSIYEKLILFCGIDENGTNYPRGVFNPHAWSKDEYYDELARAQKIDMDKREAAKKDRKKVEFISGVVKKAVAAPAAAAATAAAAQGAAAAGQAPAAAKKRSKWDQETKT